MLSLLVALGSLQLLQTPRFLSISLWLAQIPSTTSSKQLYTHAPFLSSLSLFHVLCVFASLIPSLMLYDPTPAGSLTQTKKTPTRLSAKHCLAASLLDPESLILHSSQENDGYLVLAALLLLEAGIYSLIF
ncbi:hypothetical protein M441DRAFT_251053 [Trichoderma asperellum CBS 433.97]|uniref:Uncharacterized protein n=1 Tax=Trichoderma asperellum (strain ATCC 204424 / CBS 433.97 / NBRC 101777) TaxID=1042311 RepID=A0A2T3Z0N6_TRIA4|nr:hypothetical protein M441DRAFT_251053 [Trichoderma asperellum CBS 433.97]PTB38357.1 hypothetical protein M441DRAFT_251053 [Trichoderma asperellum CBS 433.97]